jgi:hypothetical protein
MEVSTNRTWSWRSEKIAEFLAFPLLPLWLTAAVCDGLLRAMQAWKVGGATLSSLLPPFFFLALPPLFYLALFVMNVPVTAARRNGWFFGAAPHIDPTLMWRLLNPNLIKWELVARCSPTIIALTVFRYNGVN